MRTAFFVLMTFFAAVATAQTPADFHELGWSMDNGCPEEIEVPADNATFDQHSWPAGCTPTVVLTGGETGTGFQFGSKLSLGLVLFDSQVEDFSGDTRSGIAGLAEFELDFVDRSRPVSYHLSVGAIGSPADDLGVGPTVRFARGWFANRVGVQYLGVRATYLTSRFWQVGYHPRVSWHGDSIELFVEPAVGFGRQGEDIPYDVDPETGVHHTPVDYDMVFQDSGVYGAVTVGVTFRL